MPADLEAIVAAARRPRGIQISLHYLGERMGQRDRPFPEDIIRGLAEDDPAIIGDDQGNRDDRGGVCRIVCRAPNGRRLEVRVNYEDSPPRVVTAFWLSRSA